MWRCAVAAAAVLACVLAAVAPSPCPAAPGGSVSVGSNADVVLADCAGVVSVACSVGSDGRWANASIAVVNSTVGGIACGNATTIVNVTVLLRGCRLPMEGAPLYVVSLGPSGSSSATASGITLRVADSSFAWAWPGGAAGLVQFASFATLSGVSVVVLAARA